MVDNLADTLPSFPGRANHTRCFLHTVNLVAKSLIKEFDMTKKDATRVLNNDSSDTSGDLESDWQEDDGLNADITDYSAGDDGLGDDEDGWVDEVNLLSDHERKQLQNDIRPVKLVLVKVS
jgi:hypothetical protein